MEKENDIGVIPPKEIDSFSRSLFLSTFFKMSMALIIPLAFVFGLFKGFLIAVGLSIPFTFIIMLMAENVSGMTKILYGGTTRLKVPIRERMGIVLKTVRLAKMNKDYSKAIAIVNDILLQDPNYPEALFVKAQILHEGFNNIEGAKKLLKKAIDQTQPEDTIHNWASSLYQQLNRKNPNLSE